MSHSPQKVSVSFDRAPAKKEDIYEFQASEGDKKIIFKTSLSFKDAREQQTCFISIYRHAGEEALDDKTVIEVFSFLKNDKNEVGYYTYKESRKGAVERKAPELKHVAIDKDFKMALHDKKITYDNGDRYNVIYKKGQSWGDVVYDNAQTTLSLEDQKRYLLAVWQREKAHFSSQAASVRFFNNHNDVGVDLGDVAYVGPALPAYTIYRGNIRVKSGLLEPFENGEYRPLNPEEMTAVKVHRVALRELHQITLGRSLGKVIGAVFYWVVLGIFTVPYYLWHRAEYQDAATLAQTFAPIDEQNPKHLSPKATLSQVKFISELFRDSDPTVYNKKSGTQELSEILRQAYADGMLFVDEAARKAEYKKEYNKWRALPKKERGEAPKSSDYLSARKPAIAALLAQKLANLPINRPLLIPIAFGEGREYLPHFLVFEKSSDTELTMKHISCSSPQIERTTQVTTSFDMSKLLESERAREQFFEELLALVPSDVTKEQGAPTYVNGALEKVFVTPEYGKLIVERTPLIQNSSTDPVKILYTVIQEMKVANPVAEVTDTYNEILKTKSRFYEYYVNYLIQFLAKNESHLEDRQKIQVMQAIKWYAVKLRHYLEEEIGASNAESVTQNLLDALEEQLKTCEKTLEREKTTLKNLEATVKLFKKKLDRPLNSSLKQAQGLDSVKVDGLRLASKTTAKIAALDHLLSIQLAPFETREKAYIQLEVLVNEVEKYLEAGNTKLAKMLAMAILKKFPPPLADGLNIWDLLATKQEIQKWHQLIYNLTERTFEAAMRSHEYPLAHHEITEFNIVTPLILRKLFSRILKCAADPAEDVFADQLASLHGQFECFAQSYQLKGSIRTTYREQFNTLLKRSERADNFPELFKNAKKACAAKMDLREVDFHGLNTIAFDHLQKKFSALFERQFQEYLDKKLHQQISPKLLGSLGEKAEEFLKKIASLSPSVSLTAQDAGENKLRDVIESVKREFDKASTLRAVDTAMKKFEKDFEEALSATLKNYYEKLTKDLRGYLDALNNEIAATFKDEYDADVPRVPPDAFTTFFSSYTQAAENIQKLQGVKEFFLDRERAKKEQEELKKLEKTWQKEDVREREAFKEYEEKCKKHERYKDALKLFEETERKYREQYDAYQQQLAAYERYLRQWRQLDPKERVHLTAVSRPAPLLRGRHPRLDSNLEEYEPQKPKGYDLSDNQRKEQKRKARYEAFVNALKTINSEKGFIQELDRVDVTKLSPNEWVKNDSSSKLKAVFGRFAREIRLAKQTFAYAYYARHQDMQTYLDYEVLKDAGKVMDSLLMRQDRSLTASAHPKDDLRLQECTQFLNSMRAQLQKPREQETFSGLGSFIIGYNKIDDDLKPNTKVFNSVTHKAQGYFQTEKEGYEHLAVFELSHLRKTLEMRKIIEEKGEDLTTLEYYHSNLASAGLAALGGSNSVDHATFKDEVTGMHRLYLHAGYYQGGSRFGAPTILLSSSLSSDSATFCTKRKGEKNSATKNRAPYIGEVGVAALDETFEADTESQMLARSNETIPLTKGETLDSLQKFLLRAVPLEDTQPLSTVRSTNLSHLSIAQAMHVIHQDKDLLKEESVQHYLYDHLFQREKLAEALEKNPDFFVELGKNLREWSLHLYNRSSSDINYLLAALFLVDFSRKVLLYAKELESLKKLKADNVNAIQNALPLCDKGAMIAYFVKGSATESQKIFATYLLSFYIDEMDSLKNRYEEKQYRQKLEELFTPEDMKNFIKAYCILLLSPFKMGHSGIIARIKAKAVSEVFPLLKQLIEARGERERNKFLNDISKKEGAIWEEKEHVYILRDKSNKELHRMDFLQGLGLKVDIKSGTRGYLPSYLCDKDSDYFFLFKRTAPLMDNEQLKEGRKKHFWADQKSGIQFHIIEEARKNEIDNPESQLYQTDDKGNIYRFSRLALDKSLSGFAFSQNNEALEKLIDEKGVWILQKNGKDVLEEIYVAPLNHNLSTDPIHITLKDNWITEATMGSGKDKKYVCSGLATNQTNFLSFRGVGKLLLLSKDKKFVDEIRFPSLKNGSGKNGEEKYSLILKRHSKERTKWVVHDREHLEWQLTDTRKIEQQFGANYSDFLLPLINTETGDAEYWIYPYFATSYGKEGSPVKFLKNARDFAEFIEEIYRLFTNNELLKRIQEDKDSDAAKALSELVNTVTKPKFLEEIKNEHAKKLLQAAINDGTIGLVLKGLAGVIDNIYSNKEVVALISKALQQAMDKPEDREAEAENDPANFKKIMQSVFEPFKQIFSPDPVRYVLKQKGVEEGSHATFLYLAFHASLQGEWAVASRYLTQMLEVAKTEHEHEVSQFRYMVAKMLGTNFVVQLAQGNKFVLPNSTRKVAFQLKLFLTLEKARQKMISIYKTDIPGPLDDILKALNDQMRPLVERGYMMLLANEYRKQVQAKHRDLKEQGLVLSAEELRLLSQMIPLDLIGLTESLASASELFGQDVAKHVDPIKNWLKPNIEKQLKPIVFKIPTKTELYELMEAVASKMARDPIDIETLHKKEGSFPKSTTVVTHFWSYVRWIYNNDLAPEELSFLLHDINGLPEVETARRALLLFYHKKPDIVESQNQSDDRQATILENTLNAIESLALKLPDFSQMNERVLERAKLLVEDPTIVNFSKVVQEKAVTAFIDYGSHLPQTLQGQQNRGPAEDLKSNSQMFFKLLLNDIQPGSTLTLRKIVRPQSTAFLLSEQVSEKHVPEEHVSESEKKYDDRPRIQEVTEQKYPVPSRSFITSEDQKKQEAWHTFKVRMRGMLKLGTDGIRTLQGMNILSSEGQNQNVPIVMLKLYEKDSPVVKAIIKFFENDSIEQLKPHFDAILMHNDFSAAYNEFINAFDVKALFSFSGEENFKEIDEIFTIIRAASDESLDSKFLKGTEDKAPEIKAYKKDPVFHAIVGFFRDLKNKFKTGYEVYHNQKPQKVADAPIYLSSNERVEWKKFFNTVKVDLQQNVKNSKKYFTKSSSPMEELQNEKLHKGLDSAAESLKEKCSQSLQVNSLSSLKLQIDARYAHAEQEHTELRNAILKFAGSYAEDLEIEHLFTSHGKISKELRFEHLIDKYASGTWPKNELVNKLDTLITHFLLAVTEAQQLKKAQKVRDSMWNFLDIICKQLPSDEQIQQHLQAAKIDTKDKDPIRLWVQLQADQNINKWLLPSNDLLQYLNEGSNRLRYAKKEQERYVLDDPELSRKYLVMDYRKEQITRLKAKETVERIVQEKAKFVKLRMGLGKTTFIFPTLAKRFMEMGKSPVVMTTEELLPELRGSLDSRAYTFNFDIGYGMGEKPKEVKDEEWEQQILKHLQNLEKSLSALRREGRYILTTPARIAAIRNKRIELDHSLTRETNIKKRIAIFTKLQIAKKIEGYFNCNAHEDIIFLQDEDINLDISFEYNYAIDQKVAVDTISYNMAEHFVLTLLENPEFYKRIHEGTLRALKDPIEALRPIAEQMYDQLVYACTHKPEDLTQLRKVHKDDPQMLSLINSAAFWQHKSVGWDPTKREWLPKNKTEFVNYLLGKQETPPEGMPEWTQKMREDEVYARPLHYIAELKVILSRTFSSTYQVHPTLARGIKAEDGCSVGPCADGVEKPRTEYGNEREYILHHLMHYAFFAQNATVSQPRLAVSEEFFLAERSRLSVRDGTISDFSNTTWKKWDTNIASVRNKTHKTSEYAAFLHADCWRERLQFLRYLMLETDKMRIYRNQIVCNSQDTVIHSDKVFIASGTGDEVSLNAVDVKSGIYEKEDEIAGETFLGFFGLQDGKNATTRQGLDKKVRIFSDAAAHMIELANDKSYSAIINSGYEVPQSTIEKFVSVLRKAAPGRQIGFRDSKEEREKLLWNPGDHSTPVAYEKDNVQENALFIYWPVDGRGVDFAIPRGRVATLIDLSDDNDSAQQRFWRARQHGYGHEGEIHIDEKMAKRVRELNNLTKDSEITYGHVLNAIKIKTLKDSELNHIKAVTFNIKKTLKREVDRVINRDYNVDGVQQDELSLLSEFEALVFAAHEELYITKGKIDREKTYQPQQKVTIEKFIDQLYESELKKLHRMKAVFAANYLDFNNKHKIDKTVETLRPSLLTQAQSWWTNSTSVNTIDPYKRLSQGRALVQIQQRVKALKAAYEKIEASLTEDRNAAKNEQKVKDFLKKNLPATTESDVDGDVTSNNEQQVQQQVQQQTQTNVQQEQQREQNFQVSSYHLPTPPLAYQKFKDGELDLGEGTFEEVEFSLQYVSFASEYGKTRDMFTKHLHFSKRAKQFLKESGRKGHPTVYLLFIRRADQQIHSCIVTSTEWEQTIAPALLEERKSGTTQVALYAMDARVPCFKSENLLIPEKLTSLRYKLDNGNIMHLDALENDPRFNEMMLKNKLYLDWTEFREAEEVILKKWRATKEDREFLERYLTEARCEKAKKFFHDIDKGLRIYSIDKPKESEHKEKEERKEPSSSSSSTPFSSLSLSSASLKPTVNGHSSHSPLWVPQRTTPSSSSSKPMMNGHLSHSSSSSSRRETHERKEPAMTQLLNGHSSRHSSHSSSSRSSSSRGESEPNGTV